MATVQQTTQLEFHQAMADFKTMFPTMDDDVIEAVLRSNQGAVDATIDQLLSMTTDNENDKIRQELDEIDGGQDVSPRNVQNGKSVVDSSTVQRPTTEVTTQSTASVVKADVPKATSKSAEYANVRLKDNVLGSPLSLPLMNVASSAAVDSKSQTSDAVEDAAVGGGDLNNSDVTGTPLRLKRCWCPPLLGPLPDDFLRLTIIGSPTTVVGLNKVQTEGELEDERIALFLQNEEFMAELRWNKDFLLMLDKDSPPEERLSNFPQTRSGDDDAVFKERLKNMGKMSRKKFSQLARVFTGRKKRSSAKQILTQGPAPSRDNLLLHEEDSDGT